MTELREKIEAAERLVAFAEEDLRNARTHWAAVSSMNRITHWKRVLKRLAAMEAAD